MKPLQAVVAYPDVRPGKLWEHEWSPQPARFGGLFDMADLTKSIFETASSGSRPHELLIEGYTINDCVSSLLREIAKAVKLGDFTNVLSSDRTFQM